MKFKEVAQNTKRLICKTFRVNQPDCYVLFFSENNRKSSEYYFLKIVEHKFKHIFQDCFQFVIAVLNRLCFFFSTVLYLMMKDTHACAA